MSDDISINRSATHYGGGEKFKRKLQENFKNSKNSFKFVQTSLSSHANLLTAQIYFPQSSVFPSKEMQSKERKTLPELYDQQSQPFFFARRINFHAQSPKFSHEVIKSDKSSARWTKHSATTFPAYKRLHFASCSSNFPPRSRVLLSQEQINCFHSDSKCFLACWSARRDNRSTDSAVI